MNSLLSEDGRPNGLSINFPEVKNFAIRRCCEAWTRTYNTEIAGPRGMISSALRANEAFRTAMPPLTSVNHIRDFIACTTYGLMTGTICDEAGDQLLNAAHVAVSLLRAKNAAKGRKSASKVKSKIRSKVKLINGLDQN